MGLGLPMGSADILVLQELTITWVIRFPNRHFKSKFMVSAQGNGTQWTGEPTSSYLQMNQLSMGNKGCTVWDFKRISSPTIEDNRQLITNEPVEVEK